MRASHAGTARLPPLDLAGFHEWIVERGLRGLPMEEQLDGFCRRLREAGFPVSRVNMSVGTLHPRYGAYTYVWRHGAMEVQQHPRERSARQLENFLRSPIHRMLSTGASELRIRLDRGEPAEFPILDELREEGMIEYAAVLVSYRPARSEKRRQPLPSLTAAGRPDALEGIFFSGATDTPDGFDDGHLRQVREALAFLALSIKARLTYDVGTTLLETYLGRDAGRRVLTGEIDRGSIQAIHAVIWMCDLRGYTAFARRVRSDELVAALNAYLEAMASPVEAHGGHILKFLGDGFLATFNLAGVEDEAVCVNALRAAADLQGAFPLLNAQRRASGHPTLDFGVALHLGEVLYGNVGATDRLDFTVIGPAVNEASRIAAMCRPLGRSVLVSRAFYDAASACGGRLASVGVHALRGIREPRELFTIA